MIFFYIIIKYNYNNMKRKEINLYLKSLNEVSEIKGVKFAFSIFKNRKKLENQIEEDKTIFEEILKPSDGFKEFESNRIDLCVKHSEKDDNGNPITENDQYKIIDMDLFNSELNNLSELYKNDIDIRYKQVSEYNKIMEEDIVIDFVKVDYNDLPEDVTEKQLRSIEFMINLD